MSQFGRDLDNFSACRTVRIIGSECVENYTVSNYLFFILKRLRKENIHRLFVFISSLFCINFLSRQVFLCLNLPLPLIKICKVSVMQFLETCFSFHVYPLEVVLFMRDFLSFNQSNYLLSFNSFIISKKKKKLVSFSGVFFFILFLTSFQNMCQPNLKKIERIVD